ncbi:MAG: hypothetical protein MUP13_01640 [Thermoanaerobaculales bacterium]|nr:hypothetical protein [Thermoanaerobaculales bacterium]
MTEPEPEQRPLFYWILVVAVGIYLAVRMFEGGLCVVSWLGWGTCPWSG